MIELVFLVLLVLVMVVPTVLYQTLSDQIERPFWVLHDERGAGGPYRGSHERVVVPFELPFQARGAVAFSFLFSVLGLLLVMPLLLGLLSQWAAAFLMGLPGLALAMAASVAGIKLLRHGPGAATVAAAVGVGQLLFGGWLLAVVVTVTEAQHGPVAGPVQETVARALYAVGGQLRNGGWAVPFSVDLGLGLLPVLYATASLVHGGFLLSTARALSGLRLTHRLPCDLPIFFCSGWRCWPAAATPPRLPPRRPRQPPAPPRPPTSS